MDGGTEIYGTHGRSFHRDRSRMEFTAVCAGIMRFRKSRRSLQRLPQRKI